MAKRKSKSGVNKTAAVKSEFAKNPEARPKEVVAALAEQGVVVTTGYVSTIKSAMKRGDDGAAAPVAGFRKRKAVAGKTVSSTGISLVDLQAARDLASKLGGIEQAKMVLEELKNLR
ncbi:hypothetical protein [Lignipirellula cremea]|uniref:Uncharacterized protein n=1 Tax=Lignipirellula cremea TaxID=2528010 RepID=A0A518E298_9BACT|nr:hypothetical protein [Lignipirellula cremea]QDU98219.1 hypothetical protein Pla8534_60800 [Lignipirellula cremea]